MLPLVAFNQNDIYLLKVLILLNFYLIFVFSYVKIWFLIFLLKSLLLKSKQQILINTTAASSLTSDSSFHSFLSLQASVLALSPSPLLGISGCLVKILFWSFQLGYFEFQMISFGGFITSENLIYNLKFLYQNESQGWNSCSKFHSD